MVLVVGGNYIWCLVIVVIFMGFGGAKRWDDALKSSLGISIHVTKGGAVLGEGMFSLCNTAVLKLYCNSY